MLPVPASTELNEAGIALSLQLMHWAAVVVASLPQYTVQPRAQIVLGLWPYMKHVLEPLTGRGVCIFSAQCWHLISEKRCARDHCSPKQTLYGVMHSLKSDPRRCNLPSTNSTELSSITRSQSYYRGHIRRLLEILFVYADLQDVLTGFGSAASNGVWSSCHSLRGQGQKTSPVQ